jgi:hypothetical protein
MHEMKIISDQPGLSHPLHQVSAPGVNRGLSQFTARLAAATQLWKERSPCHTEPLSSFGLLGDLVSLEETGFCLLSLECGLESAL